MKDEILYETSSGNLYADLGLADPESCYIKTRLSIAIRKEIEKQGITQTELAKRSGVNQPRISLICNHEAEGISIEVMLKVIGALGYDVDPVLVARKEIKTIYQDENNKSSAKRTVLRNGTKIVRGRASGSSKSTSRKKVLA